MIVCFVVIFCLCTESVSVKIKIWKDIIFPYSVLFYFVTERAEAAGPAPSTPEETGSLLEGLIKLKNHCSVPSSATHSPLYFMLPQSQ